MATVDPATTGSPGAQQLPGLPPPADAPAPEGDLPRAVRSWCRELLKEPRFVVIDRVGLERAVEQWTREGLGGAAPELDPEDHYLDGARADTCAFLLTLDAINFGSGWFPTLRKRPGRSGYRTIASALTDHFRQHGPWTPDQLRALDARAVARVLGQDPHHELMALYARALRDLGEFLGERSPLEVVAEARSAVALARLLAQSMPLFDDRGFWKRAQITASDLALAGVADFPDLDRLTIFADNLVPHVLRVDGVLRYEPTLAARIDRGELIPAGSREELELRAAAVCACAEIARRCGWPERLVDVWLWNRGQRTKYKALPRHRTRTVFY